ncbi:MAG: ribonuclease III family protein [Candidatus Asgardarchaeia archaeon]
MENLQSIALNKNLAKLGDNLVNLLYSLALTLVSNCAQGRKVSDKILAKALQDAGLRQYLPKRLTTHDRGDAVEAILAYLWLNNRLDINEAAMFLSKYLSKESLKSKEIELFEASNAFKELLKLYLSKK